VSSGLPAVLVLSGGGFQGLAVVRLLAESDRFRILVADTHDAGVTVPFADRFLRLPPVVERHAFEVELAAVCRAEGVRLVLPSTDHELEALAAARPDLEAAGVSAAVCDPALLATLRDKKALYAGLAEAGLPVLTSVDPGVEPEALPLIGKPRHGWGGRGVVVARAPADLRSLAPDERASRVWQPFLEGAEELSADFAVRCDGSVPAIGLRRRVRISGGFAVVSDSVEDEQAGATVRRFASWAASRGGRGLFNVQILRRDEVLVVSDVNPRLGTSAVHWRGSGFNPVLVLCAEAGLVAPESGAARPAALVRSVRYLEELVLASGPPAAPVDGVVFDLDDSLIPTKQWLRLRLDSALDAVAPSHDRDRARREGGRVIEEGPRDLLIDALVLALGWGPERREELLRAYRAARPERCPTYPDVKPSLDALRRRGLRLGLLTDNPPETQRRKLEAAGLLPFLDAVVYSREAGAEKPDGRGFARVAEALGVAPRRLAMAGDNPYRDLAGAAEAGFARLFWLRRDGASSSFDPVVVGGLPGAGRYEPVADLRQIAARLSE
jgi:FMN phosphatase YigB (HAD superfamily)/carbamoylphosphate synthase large subunit